jgi:hypothetical protein
MSLTEALLQVCVDVVFQILVTRHTRDHELRGFLEQVAQLATANLREPRSRSTLTQTWAHPLRAR